MLVATFGPNTGWVGKTITFENDQFMLEGHGAITAADVMEYDVQGHLVWESDGTRAWVGSKTRTAETPSLDAASAPSGPQAQGRLDKAREQFAKGKYRATVDTLWYVEAEARGGDRQAAEGILELASLLRDKTGGAARRECDALFESADAMLNAETRLRARVGPLAVSFVPAWFLGFHGRPQPTRVRRQEGTLWFASQWIGMGTQDGEPNTAESVPLEVVASVEVSGGRVTKDKGELFGQYALAGVPGLLLMGVSTSRTTVVVHTQSGDAAVFQVEDQDPSAVRGAVTPLLQSAAVRFWDETLGEPQAAATPGFGFASTDDPDRLPNEDALERLTDGLGRLAELHERGALTDEEFAAAKRKLLE